MHKMMDIIMLVFFATLANADDWVGMGTLDGRELPLAFGCDVSGGWEPLRNTFMRLSWNALAPGL